MLLRPLPICTAADVDATVHATLDHLACVLGQSDVEIAACWEGEGFERRWSAGTPITGTATLVRRSVAEGLQLTVRVGRSPRSGWFRGLHPRGRRTLLGRAPGPKAADAADLLTAQAMLTVRHALIAERFSYEHSHDQLTGLPNRTEFRAQVRAAVEQADHTPGVVGLLALQGFRSLEDALGDPAGDQVLRAVGRRLTEAAGRDAVICKLTGPEFGVLITGFSSVAAAHRLAGRLVTALDDPISIEGMSVPVRAALGLSRLPRDGADAQTAMRQADSALVAAGQLGGGVKWHEVARTATSSPASLAADLRLALAHDRISIAVQPLVDLATGEVRAAEALARWRHPVLGPLDPESFVLAAERSGLVGELTAAVLDQALAACAQWHRDGLRIGIAVNLTARTLADAGLPAMVAAALARHGLDGDVLTLELTESGVVDGSPLVLTVLTGLRALGVRLAVDDFGTGYASMTYLSWLAPDRLKIDKSFVRQMHLCERNSAIVRSIVELADRLGIEVVAEGVTEPQVTDALLELGCGLGQGYLFAEPMPARQLVGWSRNRPTLHPAAVGNPEGAVSDGAAGDSAADPAPAVGAR